MKIFSSEETNAIIRYTLNEQGITVRQFVDSIGESLACEIITSVRPGSRMVIFAGPDFCGAYALSAARHLRLQGYKPETYLFNIGGNKAGAECAAARDLLRENCGSEAVTEVTGLQFAMPDLSGDITVIDGIFGSERTSPLGGGYQSIVRYINESGARIIAVDVPSGLLADSTETLINRNIIHASLTLAIGMPRVGFFMRENAEVLGSWRVIPVDFSDKAIEKAPWKYRLVDKADVRHLLGHRDPFASKADLGHALIFAGSYGMMGAAVLAARACLRGGAGKLTVHAPKCGYFVLQTAVPCAMYEPDAGDIALSGIELRRDYSAVAIGPGIGTADCTIDALDRFLKLANANSRPIVLDADALNCIAIRPAMLDHIPVMSVLTPHPGEFDRLFGKQPTSYARLLRALDVSRRRHIIIILKGRYTAIIRPDGKVYFNPTGTSALATGGTGDVLTGLLASFIATGMRPELAAIAAPYIHGLAGELAAQRHGTWGVTASDVADCIGAAIKSVTE